jgi:hypothetical protein
MNEEKIDLRNDTLEPINFDYTEFKNNWITIHIFDVLHPIARHYEKCSFLIFDGYILENPNQTYHFNFLLNNFKKAFFSQINLQQFNGIEKLPVQITLKRSGYKLLIKSIETVKRN